MNPRGNTKPTPPYKGAGTTAKAPTKPTTPEPYKALTQRLKNPKLFTPEDSVQGGRALIATPKEREVLRKWTGPWHKNLRGEEPPAPGVIEDIRLMRAALEKSPLSQPMVVYRVVSDGSPFNLDDLQDKKQLEKLLNREFTWRGFTSVFPREVPWVRRALAGKRNGQTMLLLQLHLPAAFPAAFLYDVALEEYKHQHELLLPPNMVVVPVSYRYAEKQNVTEIEARVADKSGQAD